MALAGKLALRQAIFSEEGFEGQRLVPSQGNKMFVPSAYCGTHLAIR